MTRLFAGEGGVDRRLPHPAVAHARRLIDEAYTERLPLAQLARTVGMSPTYLTTLFTAEIGLSPARYQRQLRTRRAEVLLAETDRTITQIAVDLGFSSAQHFATVFREHTGLTPRAYRRSILARGEH
ncbi:helix-turn-helix domain-containing protein [Actinopolymorpha alba]|uniref:helix-turn-helix domain-containing protein n=1 Tax=Actinopolymorpha alba TaxID=533267 RepID=UPI00146C2F18|nr:AraC family transcriptional regulator [Actinopolymorpha alba]